MASASYHYTRAEDIMRQLAEVSDSGGTMADSRWQTFLAQAHVHATLALVAVQAEASRGAVVLLDMHSERRLGGES